MGSAGVQGVAENMVLQFPVLGWMATLFVHSCGALGKSVRLIGPQYMYLILTMPTSHYIAERIKHDSLLQYLTCA